MRIIVDSKIPHAIDAFSFFGEVEVVPTKEMNHATVKNADAILVRSETKIDGSLLEGSKVQFVGTATIGTDHVDLEYLQRRGIGFASCPGSNANSVAEYVLAALLQLSERHNFSLVGKIIGIVGHGNTGRRIARKAEAAGMRVLLNDPPLARATKDPRYISLEALMKADFISLHVPLTTKGEDATFHLFDERRLSAMREGSILINSSRGAVVHTEALKSALRAKHLRACVLDVWEHEPQIDVDLLRLVDFGTPHIAGYSYDGKLNATAMVQKALSDYFRVAVEGKNVLEPPQENVLPLPDIESTPESLLRLAVKSCYSIEHDDARLRQTLALNESQRGDFFRELRATYPVRREFHNYIVEGKLLTPELSRLLCTIGFTVHTANGIQ